MRRSRIYACLLMLVAPLSLHAQFPDFTPPTPLLAAAVRNDTAEVKRLLDMGANVNESQMMIGFSPVFIAVVHHNLDMMRAMVGSGADLKAKDSSGSTVLMWAAADEGARVDMVDELLKLGADPSVKNKSGESALSWAMRRGDSPVVRRLLQAGVSVGGMIKPSIEKAAALLQKSSVEFEKASGCVSCHNQSLPQLAISAARQSGVTVDEEIAAQQVNAVLKMYRPYRELMRNEPEHIPDPAISVSYALAGLAAENHKPDEVTDAMAQLISMHQLSDGRFRAVPGRPPIESTEFTATALSIRALSVYGKQSDERIARAGQWLSSATPMTNEDATMKLLGLQWSKAGTEHLQKAAAGLLSMQRSDGGWAQLPGLESDAYATGQALVALRWSGQVSATAEAFQRGVRYLLRTQMSDGSWLVRTRSFPVQKYRESGFPHGKDQWISAAGTSWAIMALSLSDEVKSER